jgi:hypothetical protein
MKKNITMLDKYVPRDELKALMDKNTDDDLGSMLIEQSKLPDFQSILCRQVDREECECEGYCFGTKYDEEERLLKKHDPNKEGTPFESKLHKMIQKQSTEHAIKNNSLHNNCIRIRLQINIESIDFKEQPKQKLKKPAETRRIHKKMIISRVKQRKLFEQKNNEQASRRKQEESSCTGVDSMKEKEEPEDWQCGTDAADYK